MRRVVALVAWIGLAVLALTLAACGGSETQPHARGRHAAVAPTPSHWAQERFAHDRMGARFTDSAGVASRYRVFSRGVVKPAEGLLVQFHGDGAREWENPRSSISLGGDRGIAAAARRHGLVTVAVHTPDTATDTWWQDPETNGRYAAELLQRLEQRYRTRNVWLVGYSGGTQFVTKWFLPTHADLIDRGGVIVFAGGEHPAVPARGFTPDLKKHLPMYFYTGADDDGTTNSTGWDALADARDGERWYREHGFETHPTWAPGTGHHFWGRFGPVVEKRLDDALGG